MTTGRLLPLRLSQWWPLVQKYAAFRRVDPLLVCAVMDRESNGGEALKPRGPSGVGDGGHGRGLMQIDDRAHPTFCAQTLSDGSPAWANAELNIDYGTGVLARCLAAFDGDEVKAIAAYNAGVRRVATACQGIQDRAGILKACDSVTTGWDYASDVLRRRDSFALPLSTPKESTS